MCLEVTHMMFTCQNLTVFVFLFFVVLAFLAASLAGQEVTTTADQRFAGGCGWWVWGHLEFLRIFGSQMPKIKRLHQYHHEYFTCDCLDWDLGRICDLSWNVWAVTWYDMKMCLLKLPQCCEKVCDVGIWRCQVRHSFDYFGVGCNVEIGNIHFMCLCVFASVLQISQ